MRGFFQCPKLEPSKQDFSPKAQIRWALAYIRERYDETYPPGSPEREYHRRVTRGEEA